MKFLNILTVKKESDNTIFLNYVKWTSQCDSYFTDYSCWPDQCCYQASLKILNDYGITTDRSQQVIIAQSSSSDCSVLSTNKNFEQAIKIIDESLEVHKLPIMVGVHHLYYNKSKFEWYHKCSGNSPSITNHFVVIVGKGYDKTKKQDFYRFYEVGTSHENKGKSAENRLYIDRKNKLIIGNTSYVEDYDEYYTITEVRKNVGKNY